MDAWVVLLTADLVGVLWGVVWQAGEGPVGMFCIWRSFLFTLLKTFHVAGGIGGSRATGVLRRLCCMTHSRSDICMHGDGVDGRVVFGISVPRYLRRVG